MKKILALMMALVMMSVAVAAAGQDGTGSGTMGAGDMMNGTGAMMNGSGSGTSIGEPQQIMAQDRMRIQNSEQLNSMIQERQRTMEQEMAEMKGAEGEVYRNQNNVRLAVHALKGMEGLVGNKGQQISAIAKEFNNSVQATIRAEENVQKRSALARLFAGGDADSAEEIEKQVEQNRNRIQELKQLREECDCDDAVRQMMQEQIQSMEQEQNRLGELAQKEKGSKGLFGWIWK